MRNSSRFLKRTGAILMILACLACAGSLSVEAAGKAKVSKKLAAKAKAQVTTPANQISPKISEETPTGITPASDLMGPSAIPAGFQPVAHTTVPAQSAGEKESKLKLFLTKGKIPKKGEPQTTYTAIPAIAVFPVIKHGKEKAFSDVPVVFADEFSGKLGQKVPGTRVLNPVYTIEEFRLRGLYNVYSSMMDYYIKSGRPEPKALNYLLSELSASGSPIHRVMFVEADVDMNQLEKPGSVTDKIKALTNDGLPKHGQYYVQSRIKVFDTVSPHHPLVWAYSSDKAVGANRTYTVTSSVFDSGDALRSFSEASRAISRTMLLIMPKGAYMQGSDEIATQLQGQILTPQAQGGTQTNNLGEQDRQAIQRLLQKNP